MSPTKQFTLKALIATAATAAIVYMTPVFQRSPEEREKRERLENERTRILEEAGTYFSAKADSMFTAHKGYINRAATPQMIRDLHDQYSTPAVSINATLTETFKETENRNRLTVVVTAIDSLGRKDTYKRKFK